MRRDESTPLAPRLAYAAIMSNLCARRSFTLLTLVVVPLLVACESEVTQGSGGATASSGASMSTSSSSGTMTTGSSSSTGGGVEHAVPPGPPALTPPDGAGLTTFAISKILMGDTLPDGTPDKANGWKSYGYDIDGDISTPTSTNLCKPRKNASPSSVYPDGNLGADNSYGRNILPIMLGVAADGPNQTNTAIANGRWTGMFSVDKLGAGATYNPLLVRYYQGSDLQTQPKFDGTDAWPVTAESLNDPNNVASAKSEFAAAYLTGNTLVTAPLGDLRLDLPSDGFVFPLVLHHAVATFVLDPTHAHGSQGMLSGVLDTAELVASIKAVAGALDPSLCAGPTIDSITTQIEQASDILKDGTQDPTKECDGISIGLGMQLERVQLGPIAAPAPPPVDPCAP